MHGHAGVERSSAPAPTTSRGNQLVQYLKVEATYRAAGHGAGSGPCWAVCPRLGAAVLWGYCAAAAAAAAAALRVHGAVEPHTEQAYKEPRVKLAHTQPHALRQDAALLLPLLPLPLTK